MPESTEGTFETRADAGKGGGGTYRLWMTALDLAGEAEKDWRELANNAHERYRDENRPTTFKSGKFNILYSTMQTIVPAIYNSTPRPDVRRRFNDEDVVGKVAAQAFERSLSHCLDEYDFDDVMESAVHDSSLRGRGQAIVIYDPTVGENGVDYETTLAEHVQWDDFRHGPGKKWTDVPWAAIRYRITREEATALNSKIGATVTLDHTEKGADKETKDVPDTFKRLTIWKIWDKPKRQVVFIAPSYKEGPFAIDDDSLNLKDFYPFPRPLYDIPDPSSLVPLVPYEMYRDQAEELDRVSGRIKSLVNVLKWRGIRPAQIEELDKLKDAADGDLIPSESASAILAMAQTGGDMNKAIWLMPIDKLIAVIRELVIHRETIKQVIFEITGIADILRGETDPDETLGAQQIKAQWGSLRMQARQREVARFARDLLRIKAEIIGEQYSVQTLQLVTGIQLPEPEQKAQAQFIAARAQAAQQEPPPEVVQILQVPTWDDVKQVMASDALRSFRVDIETNSTIQADLGQAQQNMSGFVEGLGAFSQAMGPAVQAGVIPLDIVADLLTGFARNFKLGRQAEDAIERLGQQSRQPQQQGPDPAVEAEQARVQADNELKREEIDLKREEIETKRQERIDKAQRDNVKDENAAQDRGRDLVIRQSELDLKRAVERAKDEREQQQIEGGEAERASTESLPVDLESIKVAVGQSLEAMQEAVKLAATAVEEVTALRQDLSEPKSIDVQRSNGKITGGIVTQGNIRSKVLLN